MQQPLESGSPLDDARGFRRALGHFATGVTIITTHAGGELAGVTANSFSSVSLDPPLILWSLAKSSQSLALFQKAERFAVNVLAADQVDLANRFARSGADKFSGVAWQPGTGNAPLFPGVAALFECRTHSTVDAGDHIIILGEVDRYARSTRPLLLFTQGRFGLAVDYPTLNHEAGPQATEANAQDTMLGLLWDAFSHMSREFQAERDAEGLTINQGRVLSLMERHPGASLELLARKSFVGGPALEDAVAVLIECAYAVRNATGGVDITASGRERVLSLRRRAATFETRQLAHLSKQDLDTTRKVLDSLGQPGISGA